MDSITLGKRIREARAAKKITQEQLAEMANIGAYYLGEVERGIKCPGLKFFVAIADALSVSTDYLLRDTIVAGRIYLNNEISEKSNSLSPKEQAAAVKILEAYINTL